jgi:peptidoglycan/xylan/chitin deacetylase (PgdA/CDA1 family)
MLAVAVAVACLTMGLLVSPLVGQQVATSGIVDGKIYRGDDKLPRVALTFDDGPHGEKTVKLLDLLREQKVKATFFVVGRLAEEQPDIIKVMVADGHTVGNHTYTHPEKRLPNLPLDQMEAEITNGNLSVHRTTGKWPRFFRAPGLSVNKIVADTVRKHQLVSAFCTVNPGDYRAKEVSDISDYILGKDALQRERMRNGGIILLHDGIPNTLEALPRVISDLRDRGFTFVTLDELAPATKK